MYSFTVNGKAISAADDVNLLEYMRETLRLTSLKNGCAEGVCGACMIIVDGKAMRACLLTLSKIHGKSILSLEGFSDQDKELFSWAFASAGAVQCGFCTPGMVVSTKVLLDESPNPTRQQIKSALRGNLCRCTGYVKIEEAVMLAAKVRLGEMSIPPQIASGGVGARSERLDAREKALGTGQYVDDLHVEGMLHAGVIRSPYPRVRVLSVDVGAAKALNGVVAVMTAEDIPGQRFWGHIIKDWPAIIATGEETRYVGDAIAIVAAESKQIVKNALELIKVQYERLDPMTSTEAALAEGAPLIHPQGNVLAKTHFARGNAIEAIKQAAHVVNQTYSTPVTEHAFLEPESALAVPGESGSVTVYVGSQSVYDDQHGIAETLGLPLEKVRVISKLVGGAFGGKEDLSVQHHAALLAQKTGRPVKLTLSRQESLRVHPKRHAIEISLTTACDATGKLVALKAQLTADTGAYASLGGPVLQRACTHISGPYQIPNVEIEGVSVYTNNPPGGAFRGFGVPQAAFACELNMDLLAEKLGVSPWIFRYKNALEPGMIMATGQIADEGTAIKETLLAVKDVFEGAKFAGIACALKNTGLGVGVPDVGRAKIRILQGRAEILTSAACLGQGLATVMRQIAHDITKIESDLISVHTPDTAMTPDSGTSTASRQTLFTGEAVRQAACLLSKAIEGKKLADLEGQEFYGEYRGETDPLLSTKLHPVHHVAYSFATQVVILDDTGRVQKVVAAHDVGQAINPTSVEGQIEGAIAMGLGYALREIFPIVDGIPQAKFGSLGLFRTTDMPAIDVHIIEKNPSEIACGAKGIGEIATIPTAPAVASAYYRYDRKFRNRLPLEQTPYNGK